MLVNLSKDQIYSLIVILEERVEDVNSPHSRGELQEIVNKQTGEVFKPASWNAPAKHVRYDLRRIKQRHECFSNADWSGSYLYLRG